MRKAKIAITVQINNKEDSFWTNGIKQNAVTLQEMFSLCPNVESCKLVNLGSLHDYAGTAWEPFAHNIINFQECLDTIDLAITATVSFTTAMVEQLVSKNITIVKHIMGNEYAIFSENVLFKDGKDLNSYGKRPHHKECWISPHFYEQNKDFFEIITDGVSRIGPYVWSPRFIEEHVKLNTQKDGSIGLYTPRGNEAKLLSTFEPNINLLKTCLTPVIIGEKFYRKAPHLLEKMSVFGSLEIKKKKIFVDFAKDLTAYKNQKMFFEARYPMAWSLLKHTDIVIAHQRDLALNYAYFDAAWLGFPIVHNSEMLKELGFYYEGWDAEAASDILIDVATNFDSQKDEYLKKSREYISRFLPQNQDNIDGYAKLIEGVI